MIDHLKRTGSTEPPSSWRALFEMASSPGEALPERFDEAACEARFARAIDHGEADDAAAIVIATLLAIWEDGRGFQRAKRWVVRAESLITGPLQATPLARAALAFHAFTARWMSDPDTEALMADLPGLRETVDGGGSDALRILAAASEAYVLLMRAEVHAARECVRDAGYFAPDPYEAPLPKLHLAATGVLVQAFSGQPQAALGPLATLLARPDARQWPPHLRLTLLGHQLMCLAEAGRFEEAEATAETLRTLVIPGNRAYQRSYLHYALGVGALLVGRAADALAHARAAEDIGRLSGSVTARLMPALLRAQALADLGRDSEALACLDDHLPEWHAHGLLLYLAAAHCERAGLLLREDRLEPARQAWSAATQAIPRGEPLPCLHRRRAHLDGLADRLVQAVQPEYGEPPIHIRTLGAFEVRVHGRVLKDRAWKGSRAKTLLQTIIAMGGCEVSTDRLADALWPDADGAQAHANLKVAVWRLRKALEAVSASTLGWLHQQGGSVSIEPRLCEVDALKFRTAAKQPLGSWADCGRILRLWGGDFLPGAAATGAAISAYREMLCGVYGTVARRAAAMAQPQRDDVDLTLEWLTTAVAMSPVDERNYEAMMDLLLRAGRRSAAVALFRQAEVRLAVELGLEHPGSRLRELCYQALSKG